MSDPIIHSAPFRLRVLKAMTTALEDVVPRDPKTGEPLIGETLVGKVFRGRDLYGDNDPLPMLSILEPPLPVEQLRSPIPSTGSKGEWDLLVQGFTADDRANPTDPAAYLMADVKARLVQEKRRIVPGSHGTPNPFGFGKGQIVDGKAVGNVVTEIAIGPGVVRPPEAAVSNKAYFWLTLTLKITEDIERPFM